MTSNNSSGTTKAKKGAKNKKSKNRSRQRRKKSNPKKVVEQIKIDLPASVGVLFFDSVLSAQRDVEKITTEAQKFDQLNVVIKAEAFLCEHELAKIDKVKLYAGAAWTLIHNRRCEAGLYKNFTTTAP